MKSNRFAVLMRRSLIPLLLLSSGLAGCSINPATGKREFIMISREDEIAMGEQASPELEKQFGGRVDNQRLQDYVQAVGRNVSSVSDREMPYEFTVVASRVPNAFALPGGKIFISAGLLSRMSNERQLAAVLGHETGHVSALHNVKGMQRAMGGQVLVQVVGAIIGGNKGAVAEAATRVASTMINLKYSREYEYQADELGISYMTRAGYNPWGMVELLEVLYKQSQREPGSLGEMLRTHPLTSKRIDNAESIIRAGPDYADFSREQFDPRAQQFMKFRTAAEAAMK